MHKILITAALLCVPMGAFGETFTFSSEEEIIIPQRGPADPSFINVEGVHGEIASIRLKLKSVRHRYVKETMVALSNPGGFASLIWASPLCSINNIDIEFSDTAPTHIADVCRGRVPEGIYQSGYSEANFQFTIPIAPIRPLFQTLNELILEDMNGRWILWVEDFRSGDGGGINGGWELTIETYKEPEEETEEEDEEDEEGSDEEDTDPEPNE